MHNDMLYRLANLWSFEHLATRLLGRGQQLRIIPAGYDHWFAMHINNSVICLTESKSAFVGNLCKVPSCLQILNAKALPHEARLTGGSSGSHLFGAGAFTQDGQRQRTQVGCSSSDNLARTVLCLCIAWEILHV